MRTEADRAQQCPHDSSIESLDRVSLLCFHFFLSLSVSLYLSLSIAFEGVEVAKLVQHCSLQLRLSHFDNLPSGLLQELLEACMAVKPADAFVRYNQIACILKSRHLDKLCLWGFHTTVKDFTLFMRKTRGKLKVCACVCVLVSRVFVGRDNLLTSALELLLELSAFYPHTSDCISAFRRSSRLTESKFAAEIRRL